MVPTIPSTLNIKEPIKKDNPEYDGLKKFIDKYDGEIDNLETLEVVDNMYEVSWNSHLIYPLKSGETVYVHPDQSAVKKKGYVCIINEDLAVSVFGKQYFK